MYGRKFSDSILQVEIRYGRYFPLIFELKQVGLHTEGSIFVSVYGLLFWEIIFDADVKFVFQSPYQSSPLDLHHFAFYQSRKAKIHKKLEQIVDCKIVSRLYRSHSFLASVDDILIELATKFMKYESTQCSCVNWSYSLQILLDVTSCLPLSVLACIMKAFAK